MNKNNSEEIIGSDCTNGVTVALLDNKKSIKTDIQLQAYTDTDIQGMIYHIRGQRVMLDFDLAKLYDYNVKRLNEQVKRNIDRFPDDFMFQLTEMERDNLWSQIATTNINRMSRSYPMFSLNME